ncbi:hypothetical protein L3Q82_001782 [Scortum barcoo]|uniref:Uncharacterized protein n=1 Tax=Scortum barcoo TaxID=214431 RepID=A0ACB8W4D9_9TELE|nr:hypothetical protein L3Q82_001782 [Scortum barcoo]
MIRNSCLVALSVCMSVYQEGEKEEGKKISERPPPLNISECIVTGQTKSGSQEAHHEQKNIKDRYVARIGVTGAPPWSQAWGWGSQVSTWWPGLCPRDPAGLSPKNGATWARLPVGSPPAGRSMRAGAMCNGLVCSSRGGGLDDPIPGPKNSGNRDMECHLTAGGKEPELVQWEVERRYRLEMSRAHLHA